jgi:hypothetical protein
MESRHGSQQVEELSLEDGTFVIYDSDDQSAWIRSELSFALPDHR